MITLSHPNADIFVPNGESIDNALARTTHLCVGAHQDDVEILAFHGISRCFAAANQGFASVVVTDGGGSPRSGRYANFTDEEMRQIRRLEQRKAALIGEYTVQFQLNHPSHIVKDNSRAEVVDDLTAIFTTTRPEVVYLHNPADKHDTHVATMSRSLSALRRLPRDRRPKAVYGCEVWRSLDWLLDDEKVALQASRSPHLSAALLGVFDSQIAGGKRYDLATTGRRVANATFFASHDTDQETELIFALDLTPLMIDDSLTLHHLVEEAMHRFHHDVMTRIERFSQ